MSAIFNFSSLVTVLLLLICTCTYLRELRPTIFEPSSPPSDSNNNEHQMQQPLKKKREGFVGFFWKMSRIGERLSPYVSAACILMTVHVLLF